MNFGDFSAILIVLMAFLIFFSAMIYEIYQDVKLYKDVKRLLEGEKKTDKGKNE